MSFHRVIVAFDGSPQGYDALALARRLRDPDDGVLTLACVVSGQRWDAGPHVRRPDAVVPEEIESMLAEACAAIPAGIHVRRRAPVAPSPARGLTQLAERESADLIVIGSSRHGGAGRIRLERTAGRLLEGAPCAVAIAPGELREAAEFRHIGVAYDGSREARAALAVAYGLAAHCGATVSLIQALAPVDAEPLRRRVREHAEAALDAAAAAAPEGVSPRTLVLDGMPADVIREACEGVVDLLVTGSRSYGPIQRALLGSVSKALTEGAFHPTLIVPRGPGDLPAAPRAEAHAMEVP